MAGTAILEIDAMFVTVRPINECRVWSKHFGKTYVSNRCHAELHLARYLTFISGRLFLRNGSISVLTNRWPALHWNRL
jgi:hypothetical protein